MYKFFINKYTYIEGRDTGKNNPFHTLTCIYTRIEFLIGLGQTSSTVDDLMILFHWLETAIKSYYKSLFSDIKANYHHRLRINFSLPSVPQWVIIQLAA